LRIAVEEADGLPVVGGIGYGWATAVRFAEAADRAGAAAALVMPHYLISAPQAGLVQQVREISTRTELPLIVYQRGQVKFSAESVAEIAVLPTVIGFKDGLSDLDQLQRVRLATPADLLFFNGASTAEMQARAYRAIGIPAYSSAVHAFAPEIAKAFFTALNSDDDTTVERLLREFYWPLVELRDRGTGYAVSLSRLPRACAVTVSGPFGPRSPTPALSTSPSSKPSSPEDSARRRTEVAPVGRSCRQRP
jgi:5-dehydro-4-deoxyglucarate dehydratase